MHAYPLRLNRSYWKIPLYCYHECDDSCIYNLQLTFDEESGEVVLSTFRNPNYVDGKCNLWRSTIPTRINISSFDMTCPTGHMGELYKPEMVVIPDNEFSMNITFPLENGVDITVCSSKPTTLRELLWMIKNIYTFVYTSELDTSTPTDISITRECRCRTESVPLHYKPLDSKPDEACSICYNDIEDEEVPDLDCNHTFHKDCILQWMSTGDGRGCPLCRRVLQNCSECNNTYAIVSVERHIEVPQTVFGTRNATNGMFGIHSYYLNELYVDNMIYNRSQKRLQLNVKKI
jgi:hypothetical protein